MSTTPKRGPRPPAAIVSRDAQRGRSGAMVWFSVPAAAREMGQSAKTVRRLIGQGLLPARRLGGSVVLLQADLDRFFRELPAVVSVDAALGRILAHVETDATPHIESRRIP